MDAALGVPSPAPQDAELSPLSFLCHGCGVTLGPTVNAEAAQHIPRLQEMVSLYRDKWGSTRIPMLDVGRMSKPLVKCRVPGAWEQLRSSR